MLGFGSSNDHTSVPLLVASSSSSSTSRSIPTRQGMILRSRSGDVYPVLPQYRGSKQISNKTLRNILITMLLTVFVGYCLLMFFLIRYHYYTTSQSQSILDIGTIDGSNFGSTLGSTTTSWGPTGHSMTASKDVLRQHIQQIAQERRKEFENENNNNIHIRIPLPPPGASESEALATNMQGNDDKNVKKQDNNVDSNNVVEPLQHTKVDIPDLQQQQEEGETTEKGKGSETGLVGKKSENVLLDPAEGKVVAVASGSTKEKDAERIDVKEKLRR